MPTLICSGVNRPDVLALLARERVAGMVNATVACQPALVEAYERYSEVFISVSQHVGKLPSDELLDALAVGMASGERKYGSRARIHFAHRKFRCRG